MADRETSGLLQAVEVAVTTIEDAWAVRLIDMMTSLHQLQIEGTTREMYIWGNVQVREVNARTQYLADLL